MPIFPFESKDQRIKREMQELANKIVKKANEYADYDPDKDPVLRKFRKKMGLPLKKRNK